MPASAEIIKPGSVTNALRRFIGDWRTCERGNIGIMFALMTVPFFVAGGVAVDYGNALYARTALQSAADAAVLSAASSSVDDANRTSVASSVFSANVMTSAASGATPSVSFSNNVVTLTSILNVPTTITRIIGQTQIPITVTAKSQTGKWFGGGATSPCVVALSPTANDAFSLNGTPQFHAINCSVYSNSNSSTSIRSVGASVANADHFCAVGTSSVNDTFYPLPTHGCSRLPDPLAGLAPPASDPCDGTETQLVLKKGNHTLSPGNYCSGLKIMAQANVTFEPGVYVIKGGPIIFRSGSASTGSGVGFYLTGADAQMLVNGGADANLTAAATGALAGIVAAQDAAANPGATSFVQGGGTVNMVGALYFPSQTLQVGGNGNVGQSSGAWAIVADRVELNGNGNVRIEADFAGSGLPNVVTMPSNLSPRILF